MKKDEKKPYVPPEARLIRFVPREQLSFVGEEDDAEVEWGIYSAPAAGGGSFEIEFPED